MSKTKEEQSTRHQVEVVELEFDEGGHTLWVHSPKGATVLRIKCSGKIILERSCRNIVAHSDIYVQGDITVCVPGEVESNSTDIGKVTNGG